MTGPICVATSYTDNFKGIGEYAAMTLEHYAARHGLSAVVSTEIAIDRPPAWHRVKFIPQLFDKGYSYVLWVDADAIFSRFDADVRSIIRKNADLYIVQHEAPCYPTPAPNTGVMLVRNSGWSRQLFRKIWSMEEYLNHPWWENAAMMKLMGYNALLGEGPDRHNKEMLARTSFLSDDWNYIPQLCSGGDPIIKHYAGTSAEERRRELPKEALKACFRAMSAISAESGLNGAIPKAPSRLAALPARWLAGR